MEARFTNGASVSRAWRDAEEAELLAVFQYEGDAIDFARAKLAEDAGRDFKSDYIVNNCYSGKATILRAAKAASEASRQEGSNG